MIDEEKNSPDSTTEALFEFPAPAHFDETACANAQPVQRLPANRTPRWLQRGIQGAIQRARNGAPAPVKRSAYRVAVIK
jgi:hypothetical protein